MNRGALQYSLSPQTQEVQGEECRRGNPICNPLAVRARNFALFGAIGRYSTHNAGLLVRLLNVRALVRGPNHTSTLTTVYNFSVSEFQLTFQKVVY